MGVCISALDVAGDAVDELLDRQSRYYKESKQAKEVLAKKNAAATTNDHASHIDPVPRSDLSPIYPSLPISAEKYRCRNVYDGDTLTLGNGSKVRFLGIDTPELNKKQAFNYEAKEYTKKYCHGKDIWLTFGETGGVENDKNKDHYGRLLAFVWIPWNDNNDGGAKGGKKSQQPLSTSNTHWLCINEGLIASGLAHYYSPSKSKKLHNRDKLLGLQKLARVHKRGQWIHFKEYDAIVTPSGSAFHKRKNIKSVESDCKFLARSKNLSIISVSEAYDKGLHPCRNCFS